MKSTALDFRQLFESLPGMFLILEPDFQIVAVSDAYLKATMTKRSIVGKGLFEVFPDNPEEKGATGTSNLRTSLNRVLKNRTSDTMAVQKYDIRKPASEGGQFEVRYWSPINSPLLNEKNEVTHIIHRVEDVTEFIRLKEGSGVTNEAEIYRNAQALQDANRKLSEAKEQLDMFFNVSIDMLCISSYDGYFKKVNPAFESTLGFTPQELCSNSYLYFIHPDDIDITSKEVQKQLATKEPVLNFENRYRCKDGSYRLLSWKSAPVGDFMYAAARDITDTRRAEEELKKAKEAAEISNKELESFSYSVAHDLRAPLRSMLGFSKIVLDEAESLNEQAKSNLSRVVNAAKKMGLLIDALLDLSRITRKELAKQGLDLSGMAKDILADLLQTNQKVEVKISENMAANGDPQLIKLALTNLLANALKYSSKAAAPKVEVGFVEKDGKKEFFVRDNGVGFDMRYAGKLFGVFQRLHSVDEFEGTGVGLATVQRIFKSHGGKVWAEAEIDKGATFFFTL